ncbi:MAG: class II fructose-bisphosphate aldolase [Kiritimatiellae bacterium]|nr:class II fructose-bisphosphate aldolase [Kiritimatiellia bacterium]MDD5520063.1 class II fructose-bisphosphate aldolase [Kiritimatiellia bacterium]
MKFLPMIELLNDARAGGYAVPSFCVWNAEAMNAVLRVASDLRAPVILMNGPCEFSVLEPELMSAVAHTVAGRYNVSSALHLDHGDSPELVKTCIDVGYTSVMLDYSNRPFAENAAALRKVVEMARPHGITVEGEIGHVGKADTMTMEGEGDSSLTQLDEAMEYMEQTGVDALAVSIGNAHGQYTRLPKLDFTRLEQIHSSINIPLVLHGGSGTPETDLKTAISLGIAKINVATELVTAMMKTLLSQQNSGKKIWPPITLGKANNAIEAVVDKWFHVTGAVGRD